MEKITQENISKSYPVLIDFDLIRLKGLGDEMPSDEYFELLNKYKNLFGKYLMELLPLEQIDTNMKKSKLNFVPIKEEDKDFYQMTSPLNLDYIYIRNNFYIEKLSKEDLDILRSRENLDDETREFLKRTYLSVINPYDDSRVIFYGPENGKHLCDSTDVVLGIRYDEFVDTELSDAEFQTRFIEQLKLISQIQTVLEIVALEKLGSKLTTIQYNEVSIMQKYSKEK